MILGSIVTDENLLGMSFETLGPILYLLEQGMSTSEIASALEVDLETVKMIENTVAMAKLRREMPFAPQI
ncbi:MAG: hypothetical protein ACTSSA_08860 [Candidatus Freyarchaeota archaeon]